VNNKIWFDSVSPTAHSTILSTPSINENFNKTTAKADPLIITKAVNKSPTTQNSFDPSNVTVAISENANSMVANETATLFNNESTPIVKEVEQNSIIAISENASEKNGIIANETFAEAQNHKEEKGYKVIDTDETDRIIYIANFEIDGAAIRGLTRKLNALFKRNKSEK
jgi:hypothetical protein